MRTQLSRLNDTRAATQDGARAAVPRTRARASLVAATTAGVMLAGLGGAANPAQALSSTAASGTKSALTCFAVDVSGSNLVASDGEPPSDPGPVFIRQQVVQLYDQVLADLGQAAGQEVAVVTFGTGIGTELGPVSLSDFAGRSRLEAALPAALRPSQAEAAWTDWVAGVDGCSGMFQNSGITQGMVAVLTDGFPEGPAGGPTRQLDAISPVAARLRAKDILIQPILYGAGADEPGPARQAMSRLAAVGHGQLVLAATPLDMLRSSLRLASVATGLPLGGTEIPVDGSSSLPLDLYARTARAVLVVLRSSSQVAVSVTTPSGGTLSSLRAGTGGLSLVVPITQPAPGSYQVGADGQGSVYAAELLRLDGVQAPAPRPASGKPVLTRSGSRPGLSLGLALAAGLAVLIAAAALIGRLLRSRRRPKGTLVVWRGKEHRLVDPVDIDGPVDLAELFPATSRRTGWTLRWERRAPILSDPEGTVFSMTAGETRTARTDPPSTFTWFPYGMDTSLSGKPPGRPAGTAAIESIPTSDRN